MISFLHHILVRWVSRHNRKQQKIIGITHLADLPKHSLYGVSIKTRKGRVLGRITKERVNHPQ